MLHPEATIPSSSPSSSPPLQLSLQMPIRTYNKNVIFSTTILVQAHLTNLNAGKQHRLPGAKQQLHDQGNLRFQQDAWRTVLSSP